MSMRRKAQPRPPIAFPVFGASELRFRKTLLWVGVITAFLIIVVGWVRTTPWEVQTATPSAPQPVPKFVESLKELKGTIESSMQSMQAPF